MKPVSSGFALITVLWVMALIMSVIMAYNYTLGTETKLIKQSVTSAQTRSLAKGGVWIGLTSVLESPEARQWLTDGTPYLVELGQGKVTIRVQDELGKVDLNEASQGLITLTLTNIGLEKSRVTQLTQAMLDWRDISTENAQKSHDTGLTYSAKNAAFNSVEELRLLPEMTESLYQQIVPFFTVYSQRSKMNPRYMTQHSLQILTGQQSNEMATRDAMIQQLPWEPQYLEQNSSRSFTISSKAQINNTSATIEAVVLLNPDAEHPFAIISWRESV